MDSTKCPSDLHICMLTQKHTLTHTMNKQIFFLMSKNNNPIKILSYAYQWLGLKEVYLQPQAKSGPQKAHTHRENTSVRASKSRKSILFK